MADVSVIVRDHVDFRGPRHWSRPHSEIVSAEDLGGGDVHTVCPAMLTSQEDAHALQLLFAKSGQNTQSGSAMHKPSDFNGPTKSQQDFFFNRIPSDLNPVRHVKSTLRNVDGSEFDEQSRFKKPFVTGTAMRDRRHASYRRQQWGCCFLEAASKRRAFYRTRSQRKIPLVRKTSPDSWSAAIRNEGIRHG
jgi:acetyl-CoA carboxylase carboxyltransferase component